MPRILLICLLVLGALAACGGVATAPGPTATAAARPPAGYALLFSPAPHAFRFAAPGEPVRRGATAERFELRDGDCGGSDCGNPWFRAEIRQEPDRVKARLGRDIWYGWSFYNQTIASAPAGRNLGVVLGQWKASGEAPPVFRLIQTAPGSGNFAGCDPAICTPGGAASEDVVLQLDDMRRSRGWGPAQNDGQICRLFGLDANRGKWVDIVVNTNFSNAADGYLRVWVNGVQKCDYTGPLVADPGARIGAPGPGHRRGIFASSTQGWTRTMGAAPKPTMVVFYDEFTTGRTREAVDTRLREAAGARPLD